MQKYWKRNVSTKKRKKYIPNLLDVRCWKMLNTLWCLKFTDIFFKERLLIQLGKKNISRLRFVPSIFKYFSCKFTVFCFNNTWVKYKFKLILKQMNEELLQDFATLYLYGTVFIASFMFFCFRPYCEDFFLIRESAKCLSVYMLRSF